MKLSQFVRPSYALYLALALLVILPFQNCQPFEGIKPGSAVGGSNSSDKVTFEEVYSQVFESKCLSCHAGPGGDAGLDVSNYENLMASGTVVAGAPMESLFYSRVQDGSMPPGMPLSQDEMQLIYDWIADGAVDSINVPPIVDVGSDISIALPTDFVDLEGLALDPDGSIIGAIWEQVSGPNQASIETPESFNTRVSGLIEGTYKFELIVKDNKGTTATDTIQVMVAAEGTTPNEVPVADAGADQVITLPDNSITLTGSASDADGTIESLLWEQVSGPSQATVSGVSTLTPTFSDLVEGIYAFRITATDDMGAEASDTVTVSVNAESGSTATFTQVMDTVIQPKCLSCHGSGNPKGSYDMSTYQGLMDLVVAGQPTESYMFKRIIDNSMPPNSPLSQAEKNLVYNWIADGAKNN